jgi:superkiller protein 8
LVCSQDGRRAVSVGFGGEVRVWGFEEGRWCAVGGIDTSVGVEGEEEGGEKRKKVGEVWAVALSGEGRWMVATTYDGRVGVWDLDRRAEGEGKGNDIGVKVREMSTKGSFGMCVDLVGVSVLLVCYIVGANLMFS